jgi:hypothetical protein
VLPMIVVTLAAGQGRSHGPLLPFVVLPVIMVGAIVYLVRVAATRRDRRPAPANDNLTRRAGTERAPEDRPWP